MDRSLLILVLALLAFAPVKADPPTGGTEIAAVLKGMRAEISARPSRVLIAVEDALTMNEQAACEIVKEAIESTRADAKLVGEIVFTALSHAPAMSAVIVECAVATSPNAADEIKKAMERALGGKAGGAVSGLTGSSGEAAGEETTGKDAAQSGKEPTGKGMVALQPPSVIEEGFDLSSVGVGGIYLMTPSHSIFRCDPNDPCCTGDLTPACLRP